MNRKIKLVFIIFSLTIFLVSLFNQCYMVNGEESIGSFGIIALLLGWANVSKSLLAWLANPLYLVTIILFFRNSKIAIITGNLALLFSLSFLVVNDVLIDEAGGVGKVESYLLGYWLWLVSIAIVTTCTIIDKFSRPSNS